MEKDKVLEQRPLHDPPQGMEPYDMKTTSDLGALSDDQQAKLNKFKMKTRLENEKYLRQHPEVECLVAGFLGDIFLKRPDNVRDFAANYFTDKDLPNKIETMLEERQQQIRQNRVLRKL
ncbi:DgyrCDS12645 [Dimorphilus gyrociliatus]|uniref:DgyrCDS12645 n=1 Tax=Dimorphilus gyrociliatus TaxID=2664684 RepID=A0A7I8W740_9ANNE|nr:DgyrCDS12645 [Dimorphilus gyrociliatus]